jgi:hypothetical protein
LKLDLLNKEIQDQYSRENFVRLKRELEAQQILNGNWRFFEQEFTQTGVKIPVKHNLSFVPRDIIILSEEGDRNSYFNYENFDATNLYVTISKPVRLRFLAGRFDDRSYGGSKKDFAFVSPPNGGAPTWLTGAGNPVSGLGTAGDFYLNTSSREVFLKLTSSWSSKGFLSDSPSSISGQRTEIIAVSPAANTWTLVPTTAINKISDVTILDATAQEEMNIDWRLVSAGTQVEIRSKKVNTYTVIIKGYKT